MLRCLCSLLCLQLVLGMPAEQRSQSLLNRALSLLSAPSDVEGRQALDMLEEATDLGNINATAHLGELYHFGTAGVPRDNELAQTFLKLSSSVPRSAFLLGIRSAHAIDQPQKSLLPDATSEAAAFGWFARASQEGSIEATLALAFAASTGRGGLEMDCNTGLKRYMSAVDKVVNQVPCVANPDECHGKIHGSSKHFVLLPTGVAWDPATQCAVKQLSQWQGPPRDCSQARPGRESSDCKLYRAALDCLKTAPAGPELLLRGFVLATGHGAPANLTGAAELFEASQRSSETIESLYNLAALLQWQSEFNKMPGGQQRARALRVTAGALVHRAVAKADKQGRKYPVLLERVRALFLPEKKCSEALSQLKSVAELVSGVGFAVQWARQLEVVDPEHSVLRWMEAAEQGVAVAQCRLGVLLQSSKPAKALQMWSMAAEQGAACGRLQLADAQLKLHPVTVPQYVDDQVTALLCGVICGNATEEEQQMAVSKLESLIAASPERASYRTCNSSTRGLLQPQVAPCEIVVYATQSWGGSRYAAVLLLCLLLGTAYLHQHDKLKLRGADSTSTEPSPYNSRCASPAPAGSMNQTKAENVGRGVVLKLPAKKREPLNIYGFSSKHHNEPSPVLPESHVKPGKTASEKKAAKRAARQQREAAKHRQEQARLEAAEKAKAMRAAEEIRYKQAVEEAATLRAEALAAEAALIESQQQVDPRRAQAASKAAEEEEAVREEVAAKEMAAKEMAAKEMAAKDAAHLKMQEAQAAAQAEEEERLRLAEVARLQAAEELAMVQATQIGVSGADALLLRMQATANTPAGAPVTVTDIDTELLMQSDVGTLYSHLQAQQDHVNWLENEKVKAHKKLESISALLTQSSMVASKPKSIQGEVLPKPQQQQNSTVKNQPEVSPKQTCGTEGCSEQEGLEIDETVGLPFCAACWKEFDEQAPTGSYLDALRKPATRKPQLARKVARSVSAPRERPVTKKTQVQDQLDYTPPPEMCDFAAMRRKMAELNIKPAPETKQEVPEVASANPVGSKTELGPNATQQLSTPTTDPVEELGHPNSEESPDAESGAEGESLLASAETTNQTCGTEGCQCIQGLELDETDGNLYCAKCWAEYDAEIEAETKKAIVSKVKVKDFKSGIKMIWKAGSEIEAEAVGSQLGQLVAQMTRVEWADSNALSDLAKVATAVDLNPRIGALVAQQAACAEAGHLFEPYALEMIAPLVGEAGSLSHKSKAVREAASKVLNTVVTKMNQHAVRLSLPGLFEGTNSRKWQTQLAALNAIKSMACNKSGGVARCLQLLIPQVSDQMICSKIEVAQAAEQSMSMISGVSGNKDLEPFLDQIIKSVLSPDAVTSCVDALSSTVFVQKVEAPALSLVEPLLIRGLKQNKIAMKRKVATIVANMAIMIDNAVEAAPFLDRVLPGLFRADEELADLEAKGVVQRAIKELQRAEEELVEFNSLSAPQVLSIFQRECCFSDVVDLDSKLMEYVAQMCSALIEARVFNKTDWVEAVVPYMSSFTDKAEQICSAVHAACIKQAKPPQAQEDIHEEGEDLCNCEFTLGYAAKILLSNTRLHLKRGKRYGLCGPNDCGKSTLMRSIANGQLEGFPPAEELKTVYLEHDIQGASKEVAVLDYVFLDPLCKDCDREEVKVVLEKVGFMPGEVSSGASQLMPITALSGGWKMKLALARAMLAKADIMLLDEPTNHLDVDNVAWVKNYLTSLDDVTSIIVSHDSGFMDDVCTHIIHFENRKLITYIGNLQAFVEKVPSASAYYEFVSQKLKFVFPHPTALDGIKSKGRPILSMTNVSFTYPGAKRRVLNDVSVKCTLNSRIAVIGPNGAGKSTAIKVLTGENPPCTGTTWKHPQMRFAYVAQHAFHHLESHLDKTPCEYILWRYQAGFDKELAARGGAVITPEEQKAMQVPILVKVEEGAKLVEKKLIVERLSGRRKTRNSYEYEVKFKGLPIDKNMWMGREKLEALGFRKLLLLCDEEENSRGGATRPLTQRFVLQQLGELGLEEESAGHVMIKNLSGGQKVKVVLAAAMWGSPHLVILDEPTNYLDRDSLAALAGAIKEFEGGVLLISHNRDFVEHVCKTLWIMADGKLRAEGEEDLDEKIVEENDMEDTVDHLGNVVKARRKHELSGQELKKMKKAIQQKIKDDVPLTEDEENFCIEHDL